MNSDWKTALRQAASEYSAPEPPRGCIPCSQKRAERLQDTPSAPPIAVVIASRQEGDALRRTVDAVKADRSNVRDIVVVDDGSEPPEPVFTVRMAEPRGSARARRVGCASASEDCQVIVVMDAHMSFERRGTLDLLGAEAIKQQAVVYAVCNGHAGCVLRQDGGILVPKWANRKEREEARMPETPLLRTTSLMGACYAFPRAVLERIGGWPALPGTMGWQELAVSLILARCGVPMFCHLAAHVRHDFREKPPFPCPAPAYWVNLAAAYRLAFSGRMWREVWRPRLAALRLQKGQGPVPEPCLQSVESGAFTRYRDALQERFTVEEVDLLIGGYAPCQ